MIRFALALLLATPAAAAEITRNGDVITIRGIIDRDDAEKFSALEVTNATVILDSGGGNAIAAVTIGEHIRFRKYETRVHYGSVCNSGCPFMWLGGYYRHLHDRAILGLHTVSLRPNAAEPWVRVRYEKGNDWVGAYMARMGAPPEMIALQREAEPWYMNYVSYDQIKAWGLLNPRPEERP